jgi:hypothetical protein
MKIAPRLPPWHRYDDSELGWSNIPSGVKELVLASEDGGLLDVHKIFTEFYPRCSDILKTDDVKEAYDWNLPLSIRASYVIAGDLYLEGKMHQSALMVFFAAMLHECITESLSIVLGVFHEFNQKRLSQLLMDNRALPFAHFHRAVANTQTAKLLRDFIGEMHPKKLKPMSSKRRSMLNQSLYVRNTIALVEPLRKPITLFFHVFVEEAQQYREFQIYEGATLQRLFKVCYLLSTEFDDDLPGSLRYGLVTDNKWLTKLMDDYLAVVSVNERERVLYLTTSGKKTLKQLGINEGDTCSYHFIAKESNSGDKSTAADNTLSNDKKKSSRRTKTSRRKPKGKDKGTSAATSAANQEPTTQELKEAHSRTFEPVINQLRPRLQPIRRNLDSLTLERTRPKERRVLKVVSGDKENVSNFSCTSESAAKASKSVFPIVVGQETNLYKSFKPSHGRNSQPPKTISLDLHGMSKDEAQQALDKSLHRWINLAMKGGDPWVIPVDIICGGGNQILREVVGDWIKRENQVGNRPKNYHRV